MKIKGLALEILELISVSIDFPCRLINRFECSSRNIYRIIGRLIDAGLIKRFRKDKMGSLRLTNKGQAYLLEYDRGRIGKIEYKRKYSKSEEEKRRRLHRIASTYISMRNAGVKIYTDQKPIVFSKNKVDEVEIKEPVFYSSLEIKELGIECTKIKFCRAVGMLLASNEDGFIVYNSQNALMKWSSKAEQRIYGALYGLLLDSGIQINDFAGLMIGDSMELLKRMLLSDGGTRKRLFKVDDTFNEFYYVPEDKNGDFMISILVNKEIRNEIDKELVEMFGITECLMTYACTGMDRKGQPIDNAVGFFDSGFNSDKVFAKPNATDIISCVEQCHFFHKGIIDFDIDSGFAKRFPAIFANCLVVVRGVRKKIRVHMTPNESFDTDISLVVNGQELRKFFIRNFFVSVEARLADFVEALSAGLRNIVQASSNQQMGGIGQFSHRFNNQHRVLEIVFAMVLAYVG